MTRIFTDGAEFGDMLTPSSYSGATASTTQKRGGAYSYVLATDSQSVTYSSNPVTINEVYIRVAIYRNAVGGGDLALIRFLNGSNEQARVHINRTTDKVELYRGAADTLLATSTYTIPIQTWILLEVHYKCADSSGVFEIKVDGVADPTGTFTGDTRYLGANDNVNSVRFCGVNSSSTYIDDIAFNTTDNADGLNDNSWCGEGRIEMLSPNGNGSLNEWTGSDGNSTDNYLLVDEIPASSSDYVENSTAGQQDRYAVTDFTGTGKTILRVWGECRALDTVPEGAQLKIGVRTNSVNYLSSALSLLSTYAPYMGTNYKVNPNDSAAWEDADLDGIELVLETV